MPSPEEWNLESVSLAMVGTSSGCAAVARAESRPRTPDRWVRVSCLRACGLVAGDAAFAPSASRGGNAATAGRSLSRGYPAAVRTDNGPEFTSRAFIGWAQSHGIRHILI